MKTFVKYSLLATSILVFWFIFIIINVPNIWISELLVSFLPYIWISYIGMIIALFIVFLISKHKYNFYDIEYKNDKKVIYIHMIKASIIFVLLATFVYITFNIYDFAFKKPNLNVSDESAAYIKPTVKLVTFNKLYTNTNVIKIADTLKNMNVDVIALSEVTDADKIILIDSLKDIYPNYYFTTSDVGFDNAIFSKYELTYKKEIGIKKDLLLAGVKKDDILLNIIIAHPNSPISSAAMIERNNQLDELTQQILETKTLSTDQNTRIIVAGDLNTTPWSPALKEFTAKNDFLYNIAQGQGIRFTWQITKAGGLNIDLPFIRAQIDQIFVSKNIKLVDYNIENNLGSDHKPVLVTLQY